MLWPSTCSQQQAPYARPARQIRSFWVVNAGGMAVVCALAAPLPASSGFALAPGRFILPAARDDGPLPAAEAAVSLLVRTEPALHLTAAAAYMRDAPQTLACTALTVSTDVANLH
jgi:hypothetical protein